MLRSVVALLVVANLLFLAWSRGMLSPWLFSHPAGDAAQREPQRIQAQVRPHLIRITGEPAPGAECWQAGPFGEAEMQAAESALRAAALPDLSWHREPAPNGTWWLRVPRASAEQHDALRRLPDPALARAFQSCG